MVNLSKSATDVTFGYPDGVGSFKPSLMLIVLL